MFHVYVLKSCKDGSFYIGHTKDLCDRLARHNLGRSKSTKTRIPWDLVYSESYGSRAEAQKREYQIKSKKSREYIISLIGS